MPLITFIRAFKFAWQSFWRNIWLSLVTVLILVLTLFLVSTVWVSQSIANQTLAAVRQHIDVSLFFTPDASVADVVALQKSLSDRRDVSSTAYISSDEALARFKEKNKSNQKLLSVLDVLGENPLGPTIVIKAKNLEDYPAILEAVNASNLKDKILDKDEDFKATQIIVNRISSISDKSRQLALIIGSLLAFFALLVVFNSIRIMIYSQREEIGIMKLVGASNSFIRAPYIIEATIYGMVGTIITAAIIFPLLSLVAPSLNNFFGFPELNIALYIKSHFVSLITVQLGLAVGLCGLSSSLAIGRYLKV